MMSLPVKRTWILSRAAGRLYFVCSITAFCFLVFVVALIVSDASMGPLLPGRGIRFVVQALFTIGALGLATLYIAMLICVLRFDRESVAGGLFIPVIVLFGPIGTLVYYLARYRRLLNHELEPPKVGTASV
jgi:hypothetical protein